MSLPSTTTAKDPADAVFAWFRTMLDTEPVHRDDNQLWQVFSYADVARILSDPAIFSSDTTAFNPPQPDVDLFFKGNIVAMDPPRHHKLRTLSARCSPREWWPRWHRESRSLPRRCSTPWTTRTGLIWLMSSPTPYRSP